MISDWRPWSTAAHQAEEPGGPAGSFVKKTIVHQGRPMQVGYWNRGLVALTKAKGHAPAGKVLVKKVIIHKGKAQETGYWMTPEQAAKYHEKVAKEKAEKAGPSAPAPAPAPAGTPAPAPAPAKSKLVKIPKIIIHKGKELQTSYWGTEKTAAKAKAEEEAKQKAKADAAKAELEAKQKTEAAAKAAADKAAADKAWAEKVLVAEAKYKAEQEAIAKAKADAQAAKDAADAAEKAADKAKWAVAAKGGAAKLKAEQQAAADAEAAAKAAAEKFAKASAAAKKAAATKAANKAKAAGLEPKPPGAAPEDHAKLEDYVPANKGEADFTRKTVRNGGHAMAYNLMEKVHGGDLEVAKEFMESWVKSSTGIEAVAMRGAVLAHNVDEEAQSVSWADKYGTYWNKDKAKIRSALEAGAKEPGLKKTIRAMAKVSQSMYEEEHVLLYRGISDINAKSMKETGALRAGSLVSFAETYDAARRFGTNVVAVMVPRSSIAVSSRAFGGKEDGYRPPYTFIPSEREVIVRTRGKVRGGKFVTDNVARFDVRGDTDSEALAQALREAAALSKQGKVLVKKVIIHRGKAQETGYWMTPEQAAKHNEKVAKEKEGKEGKEGSGPPAPPAAPAPKAPPAAPAPAVRAGPESVPDPSQLKYVGSGGHLGGAGSKAIYEDAAGQQYLWKPAVSKDGSETPKPFSAHAQQAFSEVASRIKATVPVKTATIDGKVGTIQRLVELDPKNPKLGSTPPANLTPREREDIGAEHVSDWLMSQHDSHRGNFVRTTDGTLLGVDKEQGFRYFGKDQLSVDYHPNEQYGEREPFYNTFWRDYSQGKMPGFDPRVVGKYIERAQAIPDPEFKAAVEPYARSLWSKQTEREAFFAKALARKADLRREFETFITGLERKRTGKAVRFTFERGSEEE